MAGILSGQNRPLVRSPALVGLSERDRADIAWQFNAYGGRYTQEDRRIVHHVEVSFVPNLMAANAPHISQYSLVNNTLTLKSPLPSAASATQDLAGAIVITWKRA